VALELIALLCAGLFAGAAIYITGVEHPARLECGTALALAEFRPSYRRGAVMQATLAALGCLTAGGAWLQEREASVLAAALLLGLAIVLTLVVIWPTNKRLLDPDLDPLAPPAAALLERWGRLHAVRSVLGAIAFLLLALHLHGAL
jgi:hypothetical protein